MNNTKTTVLVLSAVIFTFVLTEAWHMAFALIKAQETLSQLNNPRIFRVSKAQIAEVHRLGQIHLNKEGDVLAIKREPK